MTLTGKGMFIWKIPSCEGGDPNAIATVAQKAQFSHVLIKIADTTYSYNVYDGVDRVPGVAAALRSRGIEVWGWHYVKGDDPIGEADKAIERVRGLNLNGYVIDAEAEYKEAGKAAAATKFMARLRAGLPNTPIALSSFRYPSYHPQLPWREFLEKCDYNMPQVYWLFAHNAGDQLNRCVREFQAMTPFRPIIPTGAAYKEFGWAPTPGEVQEFMDTAKKLNLTAANFYSWDSCRNYLPDVWDTIQNDPWLPSGENADITSRYIQAVNTHNIDQVVALYNPAAVHITSTRTIQGLGSMRLWYQNLLTKLLPNAKFTLSGYSGSKNTRHFNWTATSSAGDVYNGNDTFGLLNDKITYHYSFFTITNKK